MKHKNYKIRLLNSRTSDFVYFLGIVFYFAVVLIIGVAVIAETAAK
jgi:hypothetical protein